jgi:hypothetical protein
MNFRADDSEHTQRRRLLRSWSGWRWVDLAAPHLSIITHPNDVAGLLLAV